MSEASSIRIMIMTGNCARHRFFSNFLAERFDVAGIVSEAKRGVPRTGEAETDLLVQSHFAERSAAEERYFGSHAGFHADPGQLCELEYGGSNGAETFAWIRERKPDFVVLFGTSIIKDPLLSLYAGRIVNLHLGLSPYYRGSATNFWPLVLGEPECVGATIHLAVSKVDAGPVLVQGRPAMDEADGPHNIGCKAVMRGAELMAGAIEKFSTGKISPQEQRPGGRLFKNKDFFPETILALRRNFSEGMISAYLLEKSGRDSRYPICE